MGLSQKFVILVNMWSIPQESGLKISAKAKDLLN
jgi:hypothetical protein